MKKSIIPAVVITIIICTGILLYFLLIMFGLYESKFPFAVILLVCCIAVALLGAMIYTLVERIKEIKEENEDDISKY